MARSTEEYQMQCAFFRALALMRGSHPETRLCFGILNESAENARVGRRRKLQGVKPGVPDVLLPVPRGSFAGLFLEFKSAKGRVRQNQSDWHKALRRAGYSVRVVRSAEEAIKIVTEYLQL